MKKVTRLFDLLDVYRENYLSLENAFNYLENGVWKSYSSSDYISISNELSMGLLAMGVSRGTKIATVMVNSPEFNFFDMGLLQVGAVQVPIYPTISEDNYKYIFNDAAVEYLVVSNNDIYQRIHGILPGIPSLKAVFSIEDIPGVRSWREILELGRSHPEQEKLDQIKDSIGPDDLATIIYTSGTTGRPKGVMLSHHNFVTNHQALAEIPPLNPGDRALSFLPLCHVYERTAGYTYQSFGCAIYYVTVLDDLGEYIRDVKPHAFAAVPRVLEKIYGKIVMKGRGLKEPMKTLFFWSLRQGHKYELDHKNGWFYELKLFIANILVFRKWRSAMGGHMKFIVSGSASLHPRLTRIFYAARIPILEAYGLTETSPGITCFRWGKGGVKFGTVGPVLRDVTLKIAEDGEILVKSPGVMLGYLNRPDKNSEVFDEEGWFHTGDIGELDEDHCLRITDRKKEIFKTSGGKYIAPQPIEQKVKESPFIEQVMVIGENRKYAAALILPNFEHVRNWCAVKHIAFESREIAARNQNIIRRIQREIDQYNLDLGQTERIKKFRLISDEWSVATGELSPTLKLRRKIILDKYAKLIDEMYRSSEFNYKR